MKRIILFIFLVTTLINSQIHGEIINNETYVTPIEFEGEHLGEGIFFRDRDEIQIHFFDLRLSEIERRKEKNTVLKKTYFKKDLLKKDTKSKLSSSLLIAYEHSKSVIYLGGSKIAEKEIKKFISKTVELDNKMDFEEKVDSLASNVSSGDYKKMMEISDLLRKASSYSQKCDDIECLKDGKFFVSKQDRKDFKELSEIWELNSMENGNVQLYKDRLLASLLLEDANTFANLYKTCQESKHLDNDMCDSTVKTYLSKHSEIQRKNASSRKFQQAIEGITAAVTVGAAIYSATKDDNPSNDNSYSSPSYASSVDWEKIDRCEAQKENCYAPCEGLSSTTGNLGDILLGSWAETSPRDKCRNQCKKAYDKCLY